MVNLVAAQKPLLHGLMKMAGLRPQMVEIEPGTTMSFWVPSETIKKAKKKRKAKKPVVVLVHGFAAEGIVTWQFQVGSLTGKYAIYIPDLLFFGGSISNRTERSPEFQTECLVKGLKKLGVDTCTVVGFSYGGMVGFKMAELHPDMVKYLVVSGTNPALSDSLSDETMNRLGISSSSDLLLPTSIKGLKALLKVAMHKKLWFPDCLFKDYLEVMFNNRKERGELLENLDNTKKNITIPNLTQKVHLLWGEEDHIFNMEIAQSLKGQLGDNATLQSIKKGGHLVHLERPCVYNRLLKAILASLHTATTQQ
ncbi:putative aminoacrylate hydrolase RutD isoform X2 [Telopea speciosissima]|uniref:putative aminoacrylate hydrolase RutD isoform X2 n=1 Tax=Telopea speciosissima TaxID=54955 RepID=UPI001CC6897A|nr:putative aminoacrylate hydrolase RutD isoform X2 [Telopea speciosissima]